MTDLDLQMLFDEVVRRDSSIRGLDVEETWRMLAAELSARVVGEELQTTIARMGDLYFEQYLHTCSADRGFAQRLRAAQAKWIDSARLIP